MKFSNYIVSLIFLVDFYNFAFAFNSNNNGNVGFVSNKVDLRKQKDAQKIVDEKERQQRQIGAFCSSPPQMSTTERPRTKKYPAEVPTEAIQAPRPKRSSVVHRERKAGGSGQKRIRAQGKKREAGFNNPNKLRIMGGVARGRKIESPDVFLRPMMGKVKEALFSSLTYLGVFESGSSRALDLFSGSGSVGIEALSRGAAEACFVDFAKECCEIAEQNVVSVGFKAEQGKAVCASVSDVLVNPTKYGLNQPFELVTCTPPYEEVVYAELIEQIANSPLLTEDTIVVIEYPIELGCLPHLLGDGRLVGLRNRRYGRTIIGTYINRPTGRLPFAVPKPEDFQPESIRKK
mmetsp:Transcript_968/g.1210  ORF Transcript_968/g.1210 Transcript_968/m.1210 type:complete len:347 (-) Transcript_968:200-1240(-)|eukprot:CAMPEP_0117755774 /NCGR_PEP_ID=MMETSP0947-20121206/13653_1 /TAXON_ID=44440 /ORGANISM="Chattonella subsalsa, Strain CCMP2191" /LENGTH=346 /DNA_ID=CAMNT_0005575175 /DNA_START=81 /DNA_END=1121 /DNA_ORIENTATION=+